MKKPSDNLFQLVKSLSTHGEKIFQALYVEQWGVKQSVSVKLFDAMNQMNIYDEETLRINFPKESFVKRL